MWDLYTYIKSSFLYIYSFFLSLIYYQFNTYTNMNTTTTFTTTTTSNIDATSSNSSNNNSRRNSFSSFVKNLLLLVSSTPSSSDANDQDNDEKETTENSPFQDLYFSFPAFIEEPTEESTSCGQSHHQSFITESSRIMC